MTTNTNSLFNKRTIYSSLFFILVINLIFISKPAIFFETNKNIISFGVGDNKTIFSLGVIIVILAFISYYLFTFIDLIFEKNKK